MSNKTRLTKDGRKMQKFLKKYGYDVGRKHAGHLFTRKMVSHIRQASEITNR